MFTHLDLLSILIVTLPLTITDETLKWLLHCPPECIILNT